MHIAFRADASLQIGTGHVMRCLTLADALRVQGAYCTFVCREIAGHLLDLIILRGHQAIALRKLEEGFEAPDVPAHAAWLGTGWADDAEQTSRALVALNVDWLAVDHYALDYRWERAMRDIAGRVMVIDDLADRPHDCDLLLDQNLGRTAEDYWGLLNSNAEKLIGPDYALLRPEFQQWRDHSLVRRANGELKTLLITMGGVDIDNATGKVLASLRNCNLPTDLRITVVMGVAAPWLEQVQGQAQQMPWSTQVLVGVNNMAQLMAESDLAIGAAGGTSLERCYMGLPTLMLVLAENQQSICASVVKVGAGLALKFEALDQMLSAELALLQSTQELSTMSKAAAQIVRGGGARFVVNKLKAIYENHAAL